MATVIPAFNLRSGEAGSARCEKDALACRLKTVIDAGPDAIAKRLEQLDYEWSIGRMMKAVAGAVVLAGVALGFLTHPIWFALAALPALFMLQHFFTRTSIVGDVLHSFGMRYGSEIDSERVALRALRGDFQTLPTIKHVEDRDALARMEGEGGIALDPEPQKMDVHQAVRELAEAVQK